MKLNKTKITKEKTILPSLIPNPYPYFFCELTNLFMGYVIGKCESTYA